MARAKAGRSAIFGAVVWLALASVLGACGGKNPVEPLPAQTLVPDFSLPDVNPNSATAGQNVTPRSQLGRVSAWYFGHST
jgi:hypothetical protein